MAPTTVPATLPEPACCYFGMRPGSGSSAKHLTTKVELRHADAHHVKAMSPENIEELITSLDGLIEILRDAKPEDRQSVYRHGRPADSTRFGAAEGVIATAPLSARHWPYTSLAHTGERRTATRRDPMFARCLKDEPRGRPDAAHADALDTLARKLPLRDAPIMVSMRHFSDDKVRGPPCLAGRPPGRSIGVDIDIQVAAPLVAAALAVIAALVPVWQTYWRGPCPVCGCCGECQHGTCGGRDHGDEP